MLRLITLVAAVLFAYSATAKSVLITGSNRGLGLEFVTQYAAMGWDVIATSRSPEDDDDLQALDTSHRNITIEQLDVTDLDGITALAEKYRSTPIDVLINNAGMFGDRPRQTWGALDRDLFQQVMDVNVFAPPENL
jgi:NAD(P)-dependent dehydrogenase (short-subunit alcohol dehydrogenase family)